VAGTSPRAGRGEVSACARPPVRGSSGGRVTTAPAEKRYQRSLDLHAEAVTVMPGGVNSNFRLGMHPVPLFFECGQGAHLFDVDGNRYIDYALGMGPDILGHA